MEWKERHLVAKDGDNDDIILRLPPTQLLSIYERLSCIKNTMDIGYTHMDDFEESLDKYLEELVKSTGLSTPIFLILVHSF